MFHPYTYMYTLWGRRSFILPVIYIFGWHKVLITFYSMSSGYNYRFAGAMGVVSEL